MGLSPADVDAMSLWEFGAAVEGYNRAHSPEDATGALTDVEIDDLSKWMDSI